MKPRLRLAVLTVAIAAAGVAPMATAGAATAQAVSPNLVGGGPATQPYPFEGSLLLDHGDGRGPRFHCGVNLIAKFGDDRAVTELASRVHVAATAALVRRLAHTSWFETNAHCVTDVNTLSTRPFDPSLLRVAIGSNLRSAETAYPVSQAAVNPFWNWTHATGPHGEQGDEALVAAPIEVPEQPVRIGFSELGETLRLIGWGLTTEDASGALPDQLQQLDTVEVASSQCAAADPPVATGEVCIANPGQIAGPCFGDSGSSALARDADGRWRIVGSASRGVADDAGVCGVAPGIYTNIAYYLPWIITTILGPHWAHGAVPSSVTSQADLALAG